MFSHAKRTNRALKGVRFNTRVPLQQSLNLIYDWLEHLACPRSLTVSIMLRTGEHRQLAELVCNVDDYPNAHAFRVAHAATKLLSKCQSLKTGIDTKEVALAGLEWSERQCRETNQRLNDWAVRPTTHGYLFRAQQIISKILGPLPSEFEDVGWSTGRTTSSWGERLAAMYKYQAGLDVTASSRVRALKLLRETHLWSAAALQADGPCSPLLAAMHTVRGDVLMLVRKNAKTDRVIKYQPHMLIRMQLARGKYIGQRLRRHGVNLRDQSINQRRARFASLTGELATVDLKSASDTIACKLVEELLPFDWWNELNDLRSPDTLWLDGVWRRGHSFSSMGNGFTFELESLIFYALSMAVCGNGVSVFGDDLILPSASIGELEVLFEDLGLTINKGKTFASGPFRESCGADWYCGVDCRPIYLKTFPKSHGDIIKFHNQCRRWSLSGTNYPDEEAMTLLRKWRMSYPQHLGPEGKGDGHYHVFFDEARPTAHRDKDGLTQWSGWIYRTTVQVFPSRNRDGKDVVDYGEGYAALSASIGPAGSQDLEDSLKARRGGRYFTIGAFTHEWEGARIRGLTP